MIRINTQSDFTTKYIIEVKFIIKGVVEKSDIVGAIELSLLLYKKDALVVHPLLYFFIQDRYFLLRLWHFSRRLLSKEKSHSILTQRLNI